MQNILKEVGVLLELKAGTLPGQGKRDNLATWNSLSMIAFVDEKFSDRAAPVVINEAETVNDLIQLLEIEMVA